MKIRVYFIPQEQIRAELDKYAQLPGNLEISEDDESVIIESSVDDDSFFVFYDWLRERFGSYLVYAGTDTAAERLGKVLSATGNILVSAESCTSGLVGGAVTEVPGSSDWFWGGYVTYDNRAKIRLGVDSEVLSENGAVSSPVAAEMAESALRNSDATVAVSITGIAGPGGGSREKPVGTVWFGVAGRTRDTETYRFRFSGGRSDVRRKSVLAAMLLVENFAQDLTLFSYCE
ncbi:MAG: nicotinamide-nucleotide amidohydrolase family protein [Spirochaetia bacterium]|nr:nicotinamide-nucleotide amidohydrolase family protein [Spirochaetia bacterium]